MGMFDFIGKAIGAVVGSVLGLGVAVVAEALDITESAAKEAMDAGCETYDEIRDFLKD